MTLKTLSAVVVRVIGWLVILEGIKTALSSVLMWMMRPMLTEAIGPTPSHPVTIPTCAPMVSAIIIGVVELGVGFFLIQNSEFFGRILCKGLDERL